ncbi:ABC transporter substrate-binding protein [Lachnospiraceae bacterium 62-35]
MRKGIAALTLAAIVMAVSGCQGKAESGTQKDGQPVSGEQGSMDQSGSQEQSNTDGEILKQAGERGSKENGDSLEKVTVILDYVANTNHTGMYVAKELGWYAEAGLDVEIIEPTEGATATLVSVGKGDFGISYQEDVTIALASKDPLPVKAIATVLPHNTSGFAVYEEKEIQSPKDFEGKTYAGWGGPGEEAVLKAVMAKEGADFSKLNMVISDGSGFAALKDQADIMWFFEGWDCIKCKLAGFPIRYMELRQLDERLDYYTPVIITSNQVISEKPDMVRSFLAATEKGYRYAAENPEESAEILNQYAPDYSMDMLKMSQEYLSGKYVEDNEDWGIMKDSVWDNYTEFLKEYGVIDKTIPASQCYTNEFLPGSADCQ